MAYVRRPQTATRNALVLWARVPGGPTKDADSPEYAQDTTDDIPDVTARCILSGGGLGDVVCARPLLKQQNTRA